MLLARAATRDLLTAFVCRFWRFQGIWVRNKVIGTPSSFHYVRRFILIVLLKLRLRIVWLGKVLGDARVKAKESFENGT